MTVHSYSTIFKSLNMFILLTITKSVTGLGGADLTNSVIGSQAVIVLTTCLQ